MDERPSVRAFLGPLVFVSCALIAARRVYELAASKGFTLDEFQWAHAAWALARGQVQYRDFFEVHFPLNYQYMSLAFRFGGDDPTAIATMRMMMLPVLALAAWGMWRVNAKRGWDWALLGPIIAFSIPSFAARAIEIRHDSLAFALVMLALGLLYPQRGSPRARALASGVALGLACWATQKVFVYGVGFFGAAVADLIRRRRGERRFLLVDPLAFLGGAGLVVLGVSIGLTVNENWGPFWRWCVAYAGQFQTRQAGFSWVEKLLPMLRYAWWQFIFAGLGGVLTLRRLGDDAEAGDRDTLLLLTWLGSWVAWVMLAVPMSYSAIPFLGLTSVFAARGVIEFFAWVRESDTAGRMSAVTVEVALFLLFGLTFARVGNQLAVDLYPEDRERFDKLAARYFDEEAQNLLGPPEAARGLTLEREEPPAAGELSHWEAVMERPAWAQFDERQNEYQLRVLTKIGELTAPEDAVYDNSGSYVARPHAFWFYYTYGYFFAFDSDLLEREVPPALRESEAVMTVIDSRFRKLPKSLKAHLKTYYQPYNGDLWLWGMSFEPEADTPAEFTFEAVRTDRYFVHPPEALDDAQLRIDGKPVPKEGLELSKGEHRVSYRGPERELSILWEPDNGERWHPNRKGKARYCCRNSTR